MITVSLTTFLTLERDHRVTRNDNDDSDHFISLEQVSTKMMYNAMIHPYLGTGINEDDQHEQPRLYSSLHTLERDLDGVVS